MKLTLPVSHLYVIAFSHKKLPLSLIGKLYLDNNDRSTYSSTLNSIKNHFAATGVMHLSTCNRCEFYIVTQKHYTKADVQNFFLQFYTHLAADEKTKLAEKVIFKKDESAVKYLMEVASSLQSMVIGEREIITQVKDAYELCHSLNLTDDLLRLVLKKVIETAKQIFSQTDIARNPVSVASLAARQLNQYHIPQNARITVIGSGMTMQNFLKYFHNPQHQYTFVSRKKEHSRLLQLKYGGTYLSLDELKKIEFLPTDILIVCTASPAAIVDKTIFKILFNNHSMPIIVDLSNPSDITEEVKQAFSFEYIDIQSLKKQAQKNIQKRKQAILDAKKIIEQNLNEFIHLFKERCIENIISEIPRQFKEYKDKAINEVFKKKIEKLDKDHQQIIYDILNYVEEKYNTVTYKKLKSILLKDNMLINE